MKRKRMDKRGEMGIGTLIIFIAMVLVAAVAATVLITTADELQMQAYSTGRTARQDVSTGLNVVHVYGERDAVTDTSLEDLFIKVKLQAGSDPIDLDQMIIQISDGDSMVALEHSGSPDSPLEAANAGNIYTSTLLMDPDEHDVFGTGTGDVMTEGTLVKLTIVADATSPALSLTTQQEVTIKLIPKHGVPTLIKFTTPSQYADELIVELLLA